MSKTIYLILNLFLSLCIAGYAQPSDGFQFHKSNKKRYKIDFINYNNLIIVKVKLNGNLMNFLLDTGVSQTVLFGVKDEDDQIKNDADKILIKGVSGNKETYAYRVQNNTLEIDELKDISHDVFVIFDPDFNISNVIGYKIQGIIGYEFFKELVVKINYTSNKLIIYNPKYFNKSLKSYDFLDLRLHKQKPYIKTALKQDDKWENYVFLLDTGSGDAIWVKSESNSDIPEPNFDDILGYGFADIVRGKRARAQAFKLGKKVLNLTKIAYPDTSSYQGINFSEKSGVLGSEIMRRFHWFIDYKNAKVYFKPNRDFSDPFNYDMSGLVLKYDGYQNIFHQQNFFPNIKVDSENSNTSNSFNTIYQFFIETIPILKVGAVRPNSAAFERGFVEGDEIITINGKASKKYDLQEISRLLSSEEGRNIDFEIKRGGRVYNKSIKLKSRFLE